MKKARCTTCNLKFKNGVCPGCGLRERNTSYSTDIYMEDFADNYTRNYNENTTENGTGNTNGNATNNTNDNATNNSNQTATNERAVTNPKVKRIPSKKVWGLTSIFLLVGPLILFNVGPVRTFIQDMGQRRVPTSISSDVYNNVTRELATDGVSTETTLGEGNYIVGIDIPEGMYRIDTVNGGVIIRVSDENNNIRINEVLNNTFYMSTPYLENLQLYKGAVVEISNGQILFASSNAQVDELETLPPNESSDTHYVSDGAVAGVDFPEGTYDITSTEKDYGSISVKLPNGYEGSSTYLYMDGGEGSENKYLNVEFPHGAVLETIIEEIALVPSKRNSLNR